MTETFRCLNTFCRIETFTGVRGLPLSACPACQTPATLATPPTQETQHRDD